MHKLCEYIGWDYQDFCVLIYYMLCKFLPARGDCVTREIRIM